MSDKTTFDINRYKEKKLTTILSMGYRSYDDIDIENIPSRELPKHILDYLYGKCLKSMCVDYITYIDSISTHVDRGSHYHGWFVSVFINKENDIQVSCHNQGIELKYCPKDKEELKAFMEVVKSLQYEVRSW